MKHMTSHLAMQNVAPGTPVRAGRILHYAVAVDVDPLHRAGAFPEHPDRDRLSEIAFSSSPDRSRNVRSRLRTPG
jgi:hypothetical protein